MNKAYAWSNKRGLFFSDTSVVYYKRCPRVALANDDSKPSPFNYKKVSPVNALKHHDFNGEDEWLFSIETTVF